MKGHHSSRSSPKGEPCCTSVLLPKNRKGCFWRSDHLGSVDARPTPGYNALQAKRSELSLVKRELHHEAGKEKQRGIFSTFPSRFRCDPVSETDGVRVGKEAFLTRSL